MNNKNIVENNEINQIIHEKIFEIIYKIVLEQNKKLLKTIAFKERIPLKHLKKQFIPDKEQFNRFIIYSCHSLLSYSSSSSSSSSS